MLETVPTEASVTRLVEDTVREVLAKRGLDASAISAEAKLADTLGLKSMDLAEIVLILEDEFETDPFQAIPITSIRTVNDLAGAYLTTLGLSEAKAPEQDIAAEMAAARSRRAGRRR